MKKRNPSLAESLLALSFMVIFVFGGFFLFDLDVAIMLVASAACAGLLARRLGYTWSDMEKAIGERLRRATPAILIIWIIGFIIATFTFSGSIPMLIFYGMEIINPEYMFITSFVICMIFSLLTGTAWGTGGTAGVALISIAAGLDVPLDITAAAIICGAVFGDKMSPLSETTNLASLTSGVNLYQHIRSMTWTTFPATIITLIVYFIAGRNMNISTQNTAVSDYALLNDLENIFSWNLILLVPFVIILLGAIFRQAPVPIMLLSCFTALIIGVTYQGFSLEDGVMAVSGGFNVSMIPGISPEQLSSDTLELLNNGGFVSMLDVIIIIYCGYAYMSIISEVGFLNRALNPLVNRVRKRGPVVVTTLFTQLLTFLFSGTSYIGFLLVPEMFKKSFLKAGMAAKTLSRSLEDAGTVIGPLVPWSAAGVFFSSTLGVSIYGSDGYAMWAILCYITPIIAVILAYTGIGIYKLNKEEQDEALSQYERDKAS
ncbi:Na+/H+ antiporter NhaC [Natribacillus halophilus]|uniref:Transporter, NhaC family n=1 Tax=Natribacillus halophilus TaxID=549003 RepID=A0A1G8N4U8_9BACI|nr:Na+/H+ antiporter NhaC [Natribacillus halophilus]SDI75173.1 transporter, NhaC family [Natribacillus halophilus]